MLIGLLLGAIAAVAAALVSLPLRSPDDAFFNTATITIGAMTAGLVAGALGRALAARAFAIAWGAAFGATVVALAFAPFDGLVAFGLPLAMVVFAITGAGAIVLRSTRMPGLPAFAAGATAIALTVGLALSGQGDAESGALSLPAATASAVSNAAGAAPTAPPRPPEATSGAGTPGRFTTQADLEGVTFVVGEGSRATFTVNEKVAQLPLPNDAVMRSTALGGDIHLDGRPSTITLDLLKFTSDQPRRDNFIQRMFTAHPKAVLTVPALTGLPERYEDPQTVKRTVAATLAINGVERPITFEVEARMDGPVLNVLGKTSFVWKDFDMRAPNTPTVQVQDRVAVEVLLAARPAAG